MSWPTPRLGPGEILPLSAPGHQLGIVAHGPDVLPDQPNHYSYYCECGKRFIIFTDGPSLGWRLKMDQLMADHLAHLFEVAPYLRDEGVPL